MAIGTGLGGGRDPVASFVSPYGMTTVGSYALVAQRHMHQYGTAFSMFLPETGEVLHQDDDCVVPADELVIPGKPPKKKVVEPPPPPPSSPKKTEDVREGLVEDIWDIPGRGCYH